MLPCSNTIRHCFGVAGSHNMEAIEKNKPLLTNTLLISNQHKSAT